MFKVQEVIIRIYHLGFRILNNKYNNGDVEVKIKELKFLK